MSNPEDTVIDAIDALVDWQLAHPEGYGVDDDDCPHCRHDWHGTPEWNCPGAFGTVDEVEQYRERYENRLATEQGALYDSWFGDTDSLSVTEGYRYQGIGFVAGAPWVIPALDIRRIVWNVT